MRYVQTANRTQVALSAQQANPLLVNLRDACAQHRTKEFLWEFCYQKYARQYDDELTIRNANKPQEELFFMGFYENFNFNQKGKKGPYDDHLVNYKLSQTPLLSTQGHIIRFVNHRMPNDVLLGRKPHKIVISYRWDDIRQHQSMTVNENGDTLKSLILTQRLDSYSLDHGKTIEVHRKILFATPSIVILETPLEQNIVTTKFRFTQGFEAVRQQRDNIYTPSPHLKVFGSYLFGENGKFLSSHDCGDTIFMYQDSLTIGETLDVRNIVEILDDNLLVFDSPTDLPNNTKLDFYHVMRSYGGTYEWDVGEGFVYMIDNIIIGKNTNFTRDFKPYDLISLEVIDNELHHTYTWDGIVEHIYNEGMMLLRKGGYLYVGQYYGEYMVGKATNKFAEICETANNKRRMMQTSSSFFNIDDPAQDKEEIYKYNFGVPSRITLPKNQNVTREKLNLVCTDDMYLPLQGSALIRFTYKKHLPNMKGSSLQFFFSSEQCRNDGVELIFLSPSKIYARNAHERSKFAEIDAYHSNTTLDDQTIWILIHEGVLRVGYSDEIRAATQLLEFSSFKLYETSYITVNPRNSFNLNLLNFTIKALDDALIRTMKLLRKLQITQKDEEYFYGPENYTMGTFCDAINAPRSMEVEYRCSKTRELISIDDITESRTCHYKFTIGTRFLCDPAGHKEYGHEHITNCKLEAAK
eukprot:TRINITY_DN1293_c0_g1_i10.p1 TRINITY_DN1293_c0_g1~~TRINITY_DN1293_c0_g1_i10.p1  ORF type:complete len:694 (+),score=90.69 TRINITY_DN1293_c0_g1_i10:1635-3716(+)